MQKPMTEKQTPRRADSVVLTSEKKLGRLALITKAQVKLWKAMLVSVFFAGLVGALGFVAGFQQNQETGQVALEVGYEASEAASVTCASVEAEKGKLTQPMVAWQDLNASGGTFIWVPNASGAGSGANDNKGSARYTVKIPKAGTYRLWGRVFATSGNDNSFQVSVSNVGSKTAWGLTSRNKWAWESVKDSSNKAVSYKLEANTYNILIEGREDGTKLDKLVFQFAKDATPTGMGPACGSNGGALYPDLTVDEPVAVVNQGASGAGIDIKFKGIVRNIGNATAKNFQNRFHIQWNRSVFDSRERIDESLDPGPISELTPGASKELRALWNGTLLYGTHAVQFCANITPQSGADEGENATEASNCKYTIFTVSSAQGLLGDVTEDGQITGSDMALLSQYLAGGRDLTAEQLLAADVTQNNAVTQKDADTISAFLAFNVSKFTKFGDVNFDGKITGADSVLVAQFVSGSKTPDKDQKYYGDVDGDAPIMQDDVDLINQYIAFSISEFPVDPSR